MTHKKISNLSCLDEHLSGDILGIGGDLCTQGLQGGLLLTVDLLAGGGDLSAASAPASARTEDSTAAPSALNVMRNCWASTLAPLNAAL